MKPQSDEKQEADRRGRNDRGSQAELFWLSAAGLFCLGGGMEMEAAPASFLWFSETVLLSSPHLNVPHTHTHKKTDLIPGFSPLQPEDACIMCVNLTLFYSLLNL